MMCGANKFLFIWIAKVFNIRPTVRTKQELQVVVNGGRGTRGTAKGRNIGSGSRTLHFVVAMSYDKGVIIYERYERMNGAYFADFVKRNFDNMFRNSINQTSKIFLQDGDPAKIRKQLEKSLRNVVQPNLQYLQEALM